jgi:hypothetical protein
LLQVKHRYTLAIKVYSKIDPTKNSLFDNNSIKKYTNFNLYRPEILNKNNSRSYSTSSLSSINNELLDPWFITGLTDAEGSFVCIVRKSEGHRLGWRVEIVFQIALHKKDFELLKLIQIYFDGVGSIEKSSESMLAFRVISLESILNKIIPHFNKYSLKTNKQADYLLFQKIVTLIQKKEHLKKEGLQEILNIRASLNLGLSDALKNAFPDTKPVVRPSLSNPKLEGIQPEWMSGFISIPAGGGGEGLFFIKINKDRNKVGVGVQLIFQITQHIRDEELIKSFVKYFNCGQYYKSPQNDWGNYMCTKFSDNYNIIMPFCLKYPIRGIKSKDFSDWSKAAEIIKKGDHLIKEGSS